MRLIIYNFQDVIYCADRSTGFYMIGTLAVDGLLGSQMSNKGTRMTIYTEHIRQIDLLLPFFCNFDDVFCL